jgi:hypothetical protein
VVRRWVRLLTPWASGAGGGALDALFQACLLFETIPIGMVFDLEYGRFVWLRFGIRLL